MPRNNINLELTRAAAKRTRRAADELRLCVQQSRKLLEESKALLAASHELNFSVRPDPTPRSQGPRRR
jgi:hypothetical protein